MALFPLGILSAGAGGGFASDYELIETYILGSAQSSVTFSSLGTYSTTYKHLQIRYSARTLESDTVSWGKLVFNGNSSNYANHSLNGFGTTLTSTASDTSTFMTMRSAFAGNTDTANSFGPGIIDILDPYSTTKNTTVRVFSGNASSYTRVNLNSGGWFDTASITSIQLAPYAAVNLGTGSRFSLYGLK